MAAQLTVREDAVPHRSREFPRRVYLLHLTK